MRAYSVEYLYLAYYGVQILRRGLTERTVAHVGKRILREVVSVTVGIETDVRSALGFMGGIFHPTVLIATARSILHLIHRLIVCGKTSLIKVCSTKRIILQFKLVSNPSALTKQNLRPDPKMRIDLLHHPRSCLHRPHPRLRSSPRLQLLDQRPGVHPRREGSAVVL